MSLSAIASQLYTIQTRKKVPLSTAFKLMVREDLAMRFSVYNLARVITKSEFVATVAQAAFGERTPLQRKQDEEEKRRQDSEKKFKQFTAQSIANLNKRIGLLTAITERNTALIGGIYSELGAFRAQRRMNIQSFNERSVRVPIPSKTIKGQIDLINQEIQKLKVKPKVRQRGVVPKKQSDKKDEAGFISSFLPMLLANPSLLAMIAGGALRSIALGKFAAQAYSLYNLPGAIGRIGTRMGGQTAFKDPMTEQLSQMVDTGIATVGTYTGVRAISGAASLLKNRGMSKLEKISPAEAKKAMTDDVTRKLMKQRGLSYTEAKKMARSSVGRYTKSITQIRKFKVLEPALRGLSKRFPAAIAASIVYDLSQMSNTVADRSSGAINQSEFRDRMINHYDGLVDTVGPTGVGMLMGSLVGTAMFPGIGTLGGLVLGGTFATFASIISRMFGDEGGDRKILATKIYEIIHEDKPNKPSVSLTEISDEKSTRPSAKTGEGPGNYNIGSRAVFDLNAVKADSDFMIKVEAVSKKYNLNPDDLLAVMYNESKLDPTAVNPNGGATGLIQFMPKTAESLGTTTSALKMMTRSGQMDYVDKYFESVNLPKTGVDRGTLYSYIFLPGFAAQGRDVLASSTDPKTKKYYDANKGLDVVEPFGIIDKRDLEVKTSRFGSIATFQMLKESQPTVDRPTTPAAVQKPPEAPAAPPAASRTNEETETLAVAGLQGVAGVNNKVNAGFEEISKRIIGVESMMASNKERPISKNPAIENFKFNTPNFSA